MVGFDFSKKMVRKDGKVLTKYDLACEIARLHPSSHMRVCYDVFSYVELVVMLKDSLRYVISEE